MSTSLFRYRQPALSFVPLHMEIRSVMFCPQSSILVTGFCSRIKFCPGWQPSDMLGVNLDLCAVPHVHH